MAPRKGSRQRTNWDKIKKRYLAHEWHTLQEMGEALGFTPGTYGKRTTFWREDREKLDREVEEGAYELMVQDRIHLLHKHELNVYDMGQRLLTKAARKLLGKVKKMVLDPSTGKEVEVLVDREFESDSTALVATRLAIVMIQSVIKPDLAHAAPSPLGLNAAGGVFTLPDGVNMAPEGQQLTKMSVRNFTDEELTAIIKAPSDKLEEKVSKMNRQVIK